MVDGGWQGATPGRAGSQFQIIKFSNFQINNSISLTQLSPAAKQSFLSLQLVAIYKT
jgi:hypothetical protein